MNGWSALDRFLRTDPRDVGCAQAMVDGKPVQSGCAPRQERAWEPWPRRSERVMYRR